ncbi:hypothetical protein BGZ73_006269, partial [Actinomortierella ambigua]
MAPNADTAPSYVELIRVPTSSSFADSVMLRRQAREHERKVEEERRLMKKQNEEQRRQAFLEEWRRSLAHQGSEEHGIVDATGKNAWARGLDGGDESKDEEGAPLQYLQVDPSVVDEEEEEDQEEHQAGKQQAEHSVMAASRSLPPPSSPSKPYTIQRPCTGQLSSIIPRSPSTATVSSLNSSTSTSWVNNGEPRAILQSPKSSRSNAIHTILQKHKAKTRIPTTAKATASGCSAANPIAKDKADNDDDDDEDGDTASIHSTTSSSREKAMNASSAFRYQYRRLSGVMPDATVRNGGSLPLSLHHYHQSRWDFGESYTAIIVATANIVATGNNHRNTPGIQSSRRLNTKSDCNHTVFVHVCNAGDCPSEPTIAHRTRPYPSAFAIFSVRYTSAMAITKK